jgi:hypothetical protein
MSVLVPYSSEEQYLRKTWRYIIASFLVIVCLLFMITGTNGAYARIASGLLSRYVKNYNWSLNIREPYIKGLQFGGTVINIGYGGGPSVAVNRPSINLQLLSFLGAGLKGHFKGEMFGSQVDLAWSHGLFSRNQFVDVDLDKLSIGQIPHVRAIGIREGHLSMRLDSVQIKRDIPVAGSMFLHASDIRRFKGVADGGDSLKMINFALDSLAPEIMIADVSLKVQFGEEAVNVENIDLVSSFGRASGKGVITEVQFSPNVNLTFDINLSPDGKRSIAPLLSLLVGGSAPQSGQFRLVAEGPIRRPKWLIIK